MENKLINSVAAEICAGIDKGIPCENSCEICRRQAEAAIISIRRRDVRLKARIRALESMLLEVLEIAARNEQGEYVERAKDLLFDD